jgi:hypothetical protein
MVSKWEHSYINYKDLKQKIESLEPGDSKNSKFSGGKDDWDGGEEGGESTTLITPTATGNCIMTHHRTLDTLHIYIYAHNVSFDSIAVVLTQTFLLHPFVSYHSPSLTPFFTQPLTRNRICSSDSLLILRQRHPCTVTEPRLTPLRGGSGTRLPQRLR